MLFVVVRCLFAAVCCLLSFKVLRCGSLLSVVCLLLCVVCCGVFLVVVWCLLFVDVSWCVLLPGVRLLVGCKC